MQSTAELKNIPSFLLSEKYVYFEHVISVKHFFAVFLSLKFWGLQFTHCSIVDGDNRNNKQKGNHTTCLQK